MKRQENRAPSEQEIQDMLAGLNRQVERAWFPSANTEQAWQTGIGNYLQWFKDRGIAIHLDPRDGTWKLGEAPILSHAERNRMKIDR